ncbi:MAG: hypothetical protein A2669_01285 [Candidatus Yanofskybacteria bacterium RIFCSPHIGHO2_01_FULL_48_25b]|nr:MAG: hypothetical protein A2669_01285 [Candidatus Yanofskybacteria bacterium RIFCSPHIGHO2_01_FULL_48_25b]
MPRVNAPVTLVLGASNSRGIMIREPDSLFKRAKALNQSSNNWRSGIGQILGQLDLGLATGIEQIQLTGPIYQTVPQERAVV